jgi:nucleotide-binding universal stress UspA family protein
MAWHHLEVRQVAEYKILIPLDGSRLAEHSLSYLEALKGLGETKVRILSVVDDTVEFRALSPGEADARESNLLATYQREVSADIEKHLGLQVEAKVVKGVPLTCVLKEAVEFAPDLLVVSTHGRSGPSRWRLGSVADKVIRGAACDTLVVGPKAVEKEKWLEASVQPPFKSILVPLDGSKLAEEALPKALAFAKAFASTLHLVRAVPIPAIADGFPGEAAYIPNLLDQMVQGAKAYLDEVKASLTGAPEVQTEVAVGTASGVLEDYSAGHAIDLVVMTTHGRGGLVRMALGSVTDRLLAAGGAPVLVVRAKAAAHA